MLIIFNEGIEFKRENIMKNIFILLVSIFALNYARAGSLFFNETTIGCTAMGTANALTQSDNQAQNFAMGCLIGGVTGYLTNKYYTNKIQDRYEERVRTLQTQLDDVLYQRAINASKGIGESGVIIKRTQLPAKKLGNGKFQEPTFMIECELPGRDLILGN
jgi:hypothetical protein